MVRKTKMLMYDINMHCFLDKVSQIYSMISCAKTKFLLLQNLFLVNFETGLKNYSHKSAPSSRNLCSSYTDTNFRKWGQFDNYEDNKFTYFWSSRNTKQTVQKFLNPVHVKDIFVWKNIWLQFWVLLMPVILILMGTMHFCLMHIRNRNNKKSDNFMIWYKLMGRKLWYI
mgnify:CR=1 FL=1